MEERRRSCTLLGAAHEKFRLSSANASAERMSSRRVRSPERKEERERERQTRSAARDPARGTLVSLRALAWPRYPSQRGVSIWRNPICRSPSASSIRRRRGAPATRRAAAAALPQWRPGPGIRSSLSRYELSAARNIPAAHLFVPGNHRPPSRIISLRYRRAVSPFSTSRFHRPFHPPRPSPLALAALRVKR